ncbi:MAG: M48 family metalloprotease [Lachnospiraceae bacterium]|nr:M48 family metalloprotease [Lachnospiraceae bacterium]
MYLIDFLKRMTRKSNIPVLIYLVLNVFVIGGVIQMLFAQYDNPYWLAFLIGIVLYAISLLIALSPIGEAILRLQTGCREIKRVEQINFIEPIFREVYEKAKKLDPSIPDDVQLFINGDEDPNAFATGRKTICVTEGLLHVPEDQIKAALGHEFGHLAHKDTDLILVVTVGNFIVTAIITIIKFFIIIAGIICSFVDEGLKSLIKSTLTLIFVDGLMWVWTKIGTALVMKSSRSNEFEADEFSFNLGYGDSLCVLLDSFEHSGAKGLFATLESTHPDKDDRIAKLQELGASYRSSYGSGASSTQSYGAQSVSAVVKPQPQPVAAAGFDSTGTNKAVLNNVIKCSSCGTDLSGNEKFCTKCGSAVEVKLEKSICPNCGEEVKDDASFCGKCGTKIVK